MRLATIVVSFFFQNNLRILDIKKWKFTKLTADKHTKGGPQPHPGPLLPARSRPLTLQQKLSLPCSYCSSQLHAVLSPLGDVAQCRLPPQDRPVIWPWIKVLLRPPRSQSQSLIEGEGRGEWAGGFFTAEPLEKHTIKATLGRFWKTWKEWSNFVVASGLQ